MTEEKSVAKVWVVRAGRHGEDEEAGLSSNLAIIGFHEVGDLRTFDSIRDLLNAIKGIFPTGPEKKIENLSRQLWAFKEGIKAGDIIVLPLKTQPGQIAIGRAKGPYSFVAVGEEKRHVRAVDWIRPAVPRSIFKQDLLYSLGAFLTVCRITRNNAEERMADIIKGNPDPGFKEKGTHEKVDDRIDIGQAAHDEIVSFIRANFQGHDLGRLVEAVLKAEGFITQRSVPGPDGGADILAGKGPFGLDAPTLCVQVKATESGADVNIYRALHGTMTTFNAHQGLLVCWGGFTQQVRNEARQQMFKIRLWDQSDLVQAIYRTYDRLDAEIQAELPLKRIWALVREEDEAD
jgi:restriction system protein